jgi:hypothetical protein|tara:strand:- start:3 stop:506 length:504 start_codon:yes stop_codon:yes gene_type:complete
MATNISGATGVSKVQTGAIETGDLPAGSVLQVVSASTDTTVVMSSNTLVDTGLTATITPKFSTSKILVLIHQNGVHKYINYAANDVRIKLFRGSTEISMLANSVGFTNTAMNLYSATTSTSYLDSPSTTSATTYKTQFANPDAGSSGGTCAVQQSAESTITLMEIAG